MSAQPAPLDPVSEQVQTTLFRALAVLRLVVLAYAVALNASRWREFDHRTAGWVVVAVLVVWTIFVTWAYDDPRRRRTPLLVADLVIAVAALASTPYVQSEAMLDRHASTMPSFWVMTSVLAWAISRGWLLGLAAALLVSVVDLSVRVSPNGTVWGNIFLLLLAAGIVGYSSGLVRDATQARARAERVAAAMEERARLGRVVHDGVLQVLALVQRRGHDLGGEAAELGRLAGEQEVALRALVQGDVSAARRPLVSGPESVDLVESLSRCGAGSLSVTVSGPGRPVRLPTPVATELVAVVRACLDNVARHVGEQAPAWVLVEEVGSSVVVTVRDEGPGISPGRLDAARSEGRMGVSSSICGRMADLGGTASLETGPGLGTEWELTLPLDARLSHT
jgi:signal transduction histidine kinase